MAQATSRAATALKAEHHELVSYGWVRGSLVGVTSFLTTVRLNDKERANPICKDVLLGPADDVLKPRKNWGAGGKLIAHAVGPPVDKGELERRLYRMGCPRLQLPGARAGGQGQVRTATTRRACGRDMGRRHAGERGERGLIGALRAVSPAVAWPGAAAPAAGQRCSHVGGFTSSTPYALSAEPWRIAVDANTPRQLAYPVQMSWRC